MIADPCGNGDQEVQQDETVFLNVVIRNPTSLDIPFLMGKLSTPNPVDLVRDTVVFAPKPIPAFGWAAARFVIVVDRSHTCPDPAIPFGLELEGPLGCSTLTGFTLALEDCNPHPGGPAPVPDEVPPDSVRVSKDPASDADELHLEWGAVAAASAYNLYRGNFTDLHADGAYNHISSLLDGAGWCGILDLVYDDPNDRTESGNFYYLVAAVAECGLEGPTGFDSSDDERAAGGGCP